MLIRSLADLVGTTPKAIRHYERLGLLGPVPRRGRYRTFDAAHVDSVRLVRRAQGFGFGLRELAAARSGDGTLDLARLAALVQRRLAALAVERQRLQALERDLAAVAAELRACDRVQAARPLAACMQQPAERGSGA
ncbi:MerR family transcriptional regulator [Rubrivivax rivuli]|nr:MerR family transcriptional regulator [Rubrivivax rivuli]